ncbi:MAG: hypothetical protein ABJE10_00550 [bacterium]
MILSWFLIAGVVLSGDGAESCKPVVERALANLAIAIESTRLAPVTAATAPAALQHSLVADVYRERQRIEAACANGGLPSAQLWNRIQHTLTLAREVSQRRVTRVVLAQRSMEDSFTVVSQGRANTPPTFPLAQFDSITTRLQRADTLGRGSTLAEIVRQCVTTPTPEKPTTIAAELRQHVGDCVRGASEVGLRHADSLRFQERRHADALAAQLYAAVVRPRSDTLVVRFFGGDSITETSTTSISEDSHSSEQELIDLREEVAELRRDLTESFASHASFIPLLTNGSFDHVGGGVLVRLRAPSPLEPHPLLASISTYATGATSRQGVELSAGTMIVNDITALVGVVGESPSRPIGTSISLLYWPVAAHPVLGVRFSTADPIRLIIGWQR